MNLKYEKCNSYSETPYIMHSNEVQDYKIVSS
jgi:hypothetical protein